MRIQETNEILNESRIQRNQNEANSELMTTRGRLNSIASKLPPLMRDWRFHAAVAGVITAGITATKLVLDRNREFSF